MPGATSRDIHRSRDGGDARRLVAVRPRRGGPGGGRAGPHPDPGAVPGLRGQLSRGQRGRPGDRRRHHGRLARADVDRGHPQRDRDGRGDGRGGGRGDRTSSSRCASGSAAIEALVETRRDSGRPAVRVVGLEWLDPPFAAGHWVPEQIRRAGGWDLLGADGDRSVETTWDAVAEVDPEMLILMPCGFHLPETVPEWARTPKPPWYRELTAVAPRCRCSPSTDRRTSAGRARGSSTASSSWPRSSTLTPSSTPRPIGSWTPIPA